MPEKVLQFGTGRFLRAFADCFIDEACTSGMYDGQIVMVASTPSGRAELLNQQEGRYALWTRGHDSEELVDRLHTVTSVSRVLSASTEWNEILAVARSPHLEAVLSNTTEVGLSLQENDTLQDPQSFPARLCALLHERAECFDYADTRGPVILPCELIHNNGDLLRGLIQKQGERWNLEERFTNWLRHSVLFCNTLVDRIVPGLPEESDLQTAYSRLGYEDELLTVCEPYRLWAIQGDEALQERLGFLKNANGIVLTPNIAPYRTRKIRLLNGGHTLLAPAGILAGCETVLHSMNHPDVRQFIALLLRDEIGPVLPVPSDTVDPYINEVLQRWQNPYLHHRLIDITLQSTTKIQHRVVPTLIDYYEKHPDGPAPKWIACGFAAWLRFMQGEEKTDGVIYGKVRGIPYPVHDDYAEQFYQWRSSANLEDIMAFVQNVLSSKDLWGASLDDFPGFTKSVAAALWVTVCFGIEMLLNGTQRIR